jgi:MEKHLA domain
MNPDILFSLLKCILLPWLIWRPVFVFSFTPPSKSIVKSSNKKSPSRISRNTIPEGRVPDMDAWIQLSSDSLKKFTGKSLFDYMDGVTQPSQVHDNKRYAVLSHGTQEDPIYCYFNKAALEQFQWTEETIYSLPSRYSAPDGAHRSARQADIEQAIQQDVTELASVIRQTRHGELFEMIKVLLWNVYDGDQRVGQTALYDRQLVRQVEAQPAENGNMAKHDEA